MIALDLYDEFAWYLEALARGAFGVVLAKVQTNSVENVCPGDCRISSVLLHADSIVYRLTSSFAACKYGRSVCALRLWAAHHNVFELCSLPLQKRVHRLINRERVSRLKRDRNAKGIITSRR